MNSARLPVFSTRANYKSVETQLASARSGYELLQKKSKALQASYNKLQINKDKNSINYQFRKTLQLIHRAEFFGADTTAFAKHCEQNEVIIETSVEYVCGVALPIFRPVFPTKEINPVGKGSGKLLEARKTLKLLLAEMIQAAAQASRARAIEADLLVTNRRINALEHVIIPRFENTLVFISNELEEQEREQFFMMKRLKSHKTDEN